jgi:hypothetical protein
MCAKVTVKYVLKQIKNKINDKVQIEKMKRKLMEIFDGIKNLNNLWNIISFDHIS